MPAGPLPSANELLGALSVLQSQIASAGPLRCTPVAAMRRRLTAR
jgi:hypothetical protein